MLHDEHEVMNASEMKQLLVGKLSVIYMWNEQR